MSSGDSQQQSAMHESPPPSSAEAQAKVIEAEISHVMKEYKNPTLTRRLTYIAEHAPLPAVSLSTFALALNGLLTSPHQISPSLLSDTLTAARTIHPNGLPASCLPPPSLLQSLESSFTSTLRQLDASLTQAKRDGERALVFSALMAMAEAYYRFGDHSNALMRYMEAKDWAGDDREAVRVCMRVTECSVLVGSLSHVKSQAQRVRAVLQQQQHQQQQANGSGGGSAAETAEVQQLNAQLDACLGLFALKTSTYRTAALAFLAVTSSPAMPTVISLRDCLLYGSLTALASFSRSELRSQLHSSSDWKRNADQLAPAWRGIISAYLDSDYRTAFSLLSSSQLPLLSLHPAMAPHLAGLLKQIRSLALCQLFLPYTALQLPVIAEAMALETEGNAAVEALCAEMIGEGRLDGRLDMQRGLLVKKQSEGRGRQVRKAVRLSEKVVRDAKSLMMRMALIDCDIAVMAKKKQEKE